MLNYLDDWLILADSRELVSRHRDIVLRHIHSLGIEAVCGSLQGLEKILPVAGVFWACHVKTEDFSLGERRHFAGL